MRATRWILILAFVGGVVPALDTRNRAMAQGGDDGPACPMKSNCEITFVIAQPPIDQPQETVSFTGTCQMTHLGRTDLTSTAVVDFSAGTLSGTTVYVAANGDELNSTFVGTFLTPTPTTFVLAGAETFAGGTGRFESASGIDSFTGVADLQTGTGTLEANGTLCFDASDGNAGARSR